MGFLILGNCDFKIHKINVRFDIINLLPHSVQVYVVGDTAEMETKTCLGQDILGI